MDGITNSMDMSLSKLQEAVRTGEPGMLQSMGLQRVGHTFVTKHHNKKKSTVKAVKKKSTDCMIAFT